MLPQIPTFRNAWAHLVGVALPPLCAGCGKILPATEPPGVCHTCWGGLPFWQQEKQPMPALPPHIDSFAAPFLYEDPVAGWITSLKFGDRTDLAPMLAELLAPTLRKMTEAGEEYLLVPVPLHGRRLRKRLFNQSALLAQALAEGNSFIYSPFALQRVLYTKPQVGKTRKERKKLPQKAFQADSAQVQGKRIILIDDIFTTGSTANVCAAVLKRAGATRVDVLAVAYVAP